MNRAVVGSFNQPSSPSFVGAKQKILRRPQGPTGPNAFSKSIAFLALEPAGLHFVAARAGAAQPRGLGRAALQAAATPATRAGHWPPTGVPWPREMRREKFFSRLTAGATA